MSRSKPSRKYYGQEKNYKTHDLNYYIIRVSLWCKKRWILDTKTIVDFHTNWGFVGRYLPPLEIIGCGKAEKKSPSDWLPPEEAFFRYFCFAIWGQMWVTSVAFSLYYLGLNQDLVVDSCYLQMLKSSHWVMWCGALFTYLKGLM